MTKKINNPFSAQDFEIHNRLTPYQGYLTIAQYQLRYRLFNGNWGPIITREVMERQGAVAILPYDPLLDRVILIEQFRVGALKDPSSPWLIEIVAGLIEPDETPAEVAIREANEEAGCEILDLYPLGGYFVSPGGTNEYIHIFCGKIDASRAGGVFGLENEHEDIRAFTLSTQEAFTKLHEGQINTPPAIISLQWLQLNQTWLKQLWQKT